MIKTFLFTVLLFIISSSHAQIRVGIQAGYNSAKWQFTEEIGNWQTETNAISGFNAGVLAQFDLKKRIALQGALLFNRTGTTLFNNYRGDMSNRKIKLYSLNLPVVAMYSIDVRKMRYGLGGGLYAAYILSGTEKGKTERHMIGGSPPVINPIDNKIGFETEDQRFNPGSTAPMNVRRWDAGYVVLPGWYFFGGNFKNQVVSLSLAVWLSRKK
jgi:hypothetical protein